MTPYQNKFYTVCLLLMSAFFVLSCNSERNKAGGCQSHLDFSINGEDYPHSCEILGTAPQQSDRDLVQQLKETEIEIEIFQTTEKTVYLSVDDSQVQPVINNIVRYNINSDGLHKISLCQGNQCLSKWVSLKIKRPTIPKYNNIPSVAENPPASAETITTTRNTQSSTNNIGNTRSQSSSSDGTQPKPPQKATTTYRPTTDSDNDGVPDDRDDCKYEYGSASNRGCPEPVAVVLDTDKDGVPDNRDKCKDQEGLPRFFGCPDSDDDGVPDYRDKCPDEKGTINGCPEEVADSEPISLKKEETKINQEQITTPAPEAIKETKPSPIRLTNYGSLTLISNQDCPADLSDYSSGPFTMSFAITTRSQLRTISVISNSNWTAQLTLTSAAGNQIGGARLESIVDGITEINLTQLNKYLDPGNYTLKVSGTGQLADITACGSSSIKTNEISVNSNNYFFNIDYKY